MEQNPASSKRVKVGKDAGRVRKSSEAQRVMSTVGNFVSKCAGLKLLSLHGEHKGKELGREFQHKD